MLLTTLLFIELRQRVRMAQHIVEKIIGHYIFLVYSSALLYSIALCPIPWGSVWAVLALLFLGIVLWHVAASAKVIVKMLMLWVSIVAALHYHWLFLTLRYKLGLTVPGAFAFYLSIVVLHVAIFYLFFSIARLVLWFGDMQHFNKRFNKVFWIIVFAISFRVAGLGLMLIFGDKGSCNLIGPMTALSGEIFQSGAKFNTITKKNHIRKNNINVVIKNAGLNKNVVKNSSAVLWERAQLLVQAISMAYDDDESCMQASLIVTPESFMAAPLNKHEELLSFIKVHLQGGQKIFVGAQYQDASDNLFQAIYGLSAQGIESLYLKQHAVPCFERTPPHLSMLKKIFGQDDVEFCAAQEQPTFIEYSSGKKASVNQGYMRAGGTIFVNKVCSDFFLVTSTADLGKLRHRFCEKPVVMLHVNDTWFNEYMRRLLRRNAAMRAWLAGVDLVYVGYGDNN